MSEKLDHTYNDYTNEILKAKMDFQTQLETHGWKYKEDETITPLHYQYIIFSEVGLSTIITFTPELEFVSVKRITDGEVRKLLELFNTL